MGNNWETESDAEIQAKQVINQTMENTALTDNESFNTKEEFSRIEMARDMLQHQGSLALDKVVQPLNEQREIIAAETDSQAQLQMFEEARSISKHKRSTTLGRRKSPSPEKHTVTKKQKEGRKMATRSVTRSASHLSLLQ